MREIDGLSLILMAEDGGNRTYRNTSRHQWPRKPGVEHSLENFNSANQKRNRTAPKKFEITILITSATVNTV
jgi:hypothetical protein